MLSFSSNSDINLCLNCKSSKSEETLEGFTCCSDCGMEFPWTNISNQVTEFELNRDYYAGNELQKENSYLRRDHLKKVIEEICSEGDMTLNLKLLGHMSAYFDNIFDGRVYISDVRLFFKKIKCTHLYPESFKYYTAITGHYVYIDPRMRADIYNIYVMMENHFNSRDASDFKNIKKFFPCTFCIMMIVSKMDKVFDLPYDVGAFQRSMKPISRYMVRNNIRYFEEIWGKIGLQSFNYPLKIYL